MIQLAHASGATGLELRSADSELVHPGMPPAARREVAAALSGAGLAVLALASYVCVCAPEPMGLRGGVDAGLRAAVGLAADLGAANVRVCPGAGLPAALSGRVPLGMAAADERGARRLDGAAGLARERGVGLLLETHDSHPRAEDVARILAKSDPGTPVKVIWDVMHPWRHDEPAWRTAELLADWLAYAQFKDGVRVFGTHDVRLTLPGQGTLPLRRMQELAAGIADVQGNSDPWMSLEWEMAWHPELPPLAEALDALRRALS